MKSDKKKVNKMNGTLSLMGLLLVASLIAGVLYVNEVDMKDKLATYIEREDALTRQIQDEEERTVELEERKKYVSTDQYIKEIAREKLGLVDPDEILLKPN